MNLQCVLNNIGHTNLFFSYYQKFCQKSQIKNQKFENEVIVEDFSCQSEKK
jgi:hypothetical protein